MRLMSYNIEWFTRAFDANNMPRDDALKQLSGVAEVLRQVDPDLVGITEAPNTTTTTGNRSTITALETFAAANGLRQRRAMLGFVSPGEQEIALLYDPDRLTPSHVPGGTAGSRTNPPFNLPFESDSDGDGIREIYRHYRPPLEAEIVRADGGATFRLMVVHAKSKGIFSVMDQIHYERTSQANRRKLFAECSTIRTRVEDWLARDHPVVAMGDINDGPGFDFYEERFGRSAVEIVMGSLFHPERILRNTVGEPRWTDFGWEPSTARFTDILTKNTVNALIDHILVSRHFTTIRTGDAIVWNPFQTEAAEPLRGALLDASDHFPVTLDIP